MPKEEAREKSSYADSVRTIDDLLINLELRNKCLNIISTFGELKRGSVYSTGINEADLFGSFQPYEIILLFKELGLVDEIDLNGFYKQNEYKSVGSRRVEFVFSGDKMLDFTDRANGKNSVIKRQALEFIARHIGDLASGTKLVDFLKNLGVPNSLIVYPNTKWRMIYDVLLYYASCPKPENRRMLYDIIEEASHPLMHNGDKNTAEKTVNSFNNYLEYDKKQIIWDETESRYKLHSFLSGKELEEIQKEYYAEEDLRVDALKKLENKEKIYLLKKNYQVWMNVVEVFCNGYKYLLQDDLIKLNKYYLSLDKFVWKTMDELEIKEDLPSWKEYARPFTNLFSAEKELNGYTNWASVRMEMLVVLGEIEDLCLRLDVGDILSKSDKQKQLNEITLYLLKVKAKTKEKPLKKEPAGLPTTRIEIVKMPEIEIKKDTKLPTDKKNAKEIAIYLNQSGDLYKEPKSKFCYPMGETADRHKIVRHLISNKGYQQTSQIALIFDNKSEDSIISEIGKINSTSKGKLGIKDNIILGKKGSGYRANPDYKFSLKTE